MKIQPYYSFSIFLYLSLTKEPQIILREVEKLMHKKFPLVIFLFVGLIANAQERIQRERTFGEPVFVEAHTLNTESDSVNAIVLFRIRKDTFVFSRQSEKMSSDFYGHGSIVVEILDSIGNSVARDIKELNLVSKDNTAQFLRNQYVQTLSSFHLLPGKYAALIQIEDKDSQRQFPDIRKSILVDRRNNISRSDAIPVKVPVKENQLECYNLGGDALFSENFGLAILFNHTLNESKIVYSLQRTSTDDSEDENTEIIFKDTTVDTQIFNHHTLTFSEIDNSIALSLIPSDSFSVAIVPIPGTRLKQGQYEISIRLQDSSRITTQFKTRWLDMPLTLTDLDLATLPLQYIMTEDEYLVLRKGNRTDRIAKFDEFWNKKDPTQGTAFNEMLAEFYKRTDIATVSFRTLKEQNGTMTDRGKIFILYGKPTTTDRVLKPGETPKEVWKYSTLNKTFIFEDPSKQGNYKLVESK